MPKSCVAIDPSINNCGMAIFLDDVLVAHDLLHPSKEVVAMNLKDSEHYRFKSRDICNQIRAIYMKVKERDSKTVLVTEVPEHFGNSGYIARETGSVFKLTFVCGMIFGISEDCIAYQPSKWKGQLSKEVVRNRLIRDYPKRDIETLDHNIVDAIGIGHKYIRGSV